MKVMSRAFYLLLSFCCVAPLYNNKSIDRLEQKGILQLEVL